MSGGPTLWGTEDWVAPGKVQRAPAMAVNLDGSVFMVWHERDTVNGGPDRIMGKVLAFDGEVIREAFVLSDGFDGLGQNVTPSVAALKDGRFVVTWTGIDGPNSYGIKGKILNREGFSLGSTFEVNSQTAGDQYDSQVIARDDGGFSVVWDGVGPTSRDLRDIKGKDFDANGNAGLEYRSIRSRPKGLEMRAVQP